MSVLQSSDPHSRTGRTPVEAIAARHEKRLAREAEARMWAERGLNDEAICGLMRISPASLRRYLGRPTTKQVAADRKQAPYPCSAKE